MQKDLYWVEGTGKEENFPGSSNSRGSGTFVSLWHPFQQHPHRQLYQHPRCGPDSNYCHVKYWLKIDAHSDTVTRKAEQLVIVLHLPSLAHFYLIQQLHLCFLDIPDEKTHADTITCLMSCTITGVYSQNKGNFSQYLAQHFLHTLGYCLPISYILWN